MKIFISYAHEQREKVDQLEQILVNLGHSVWFDKQLVGGTPWWDEILEQIRNCDVFLYAMSQESSVSDACKSERDYAAALKKPILPIKLDKSNGSGTRTQKIQHIEFPDSTNEASLLFLSNQISRSLVHINKILNSEENQQYKPPYPLPEPPPFVDTDRKLREEFERLPEQPDDVAIKFVDDAVKKAHRKHLREKMRAWIQKVAEADNLSPKIRDYAKTQLRKTRRPINIYMLIGIIGLIFVSLLMISLLLLGEWIPDDTAVAEPAAPIPTRVADEPTSVNDELTQVDSAVIPFSSISPTPNATELELTVQSEIVVLQTEERENAFADGTATAVASQTAIAGTAEAFNQTATLWTASPTSDVRATAEARLAATETQQSVNATATATFWTATPTPTPTPTATATMTPLPALVLTLTQAAQVVEEGIEHWMPIEWMVNDQVVLYVPPPRECLIITLPLISSNGVQPQCELDEYWIEQRQATVTQSPVNLPRAKQECSVRGGRVPTLYEWLWAVVGNDGSDLLATDLPSDTIADFDYAETSWTGLHTLFTPEPRDEWVISPDNPATGFIMRFRDGELFGWYFSVNEEHPNTTYRCVYDDISNY